MSLAGEWWAGGGPLVGKLSLEQAILIFKQGVWDFDLHDTTTQFDKSG